MLRSRLWQARTDKVVGEQIGQTNVNFTTDVYVRVLQIRKQTASAKQGFLVELG